MNCISAIKSLKLITIHFPDSACNDSISGHRNRRPDEYTQMMWFVKKSKSGALHQRVCFSFNTNNWHWIRKWRLSWNLNCFTREHSWKYNLFTSCIYHLLILLYASLQENYLKKTYQYRQILSSFFYYSLSKVGSSIQNLLILLIT